MNLETFREKSNRYFAVYAGIAAFFILGLVIVTQFIAYRDVMYQNFNRDMELEASLLTHVIESPSENEGLYRNLGKQLIERLNSEINVNRDRYQNILNIKISGFDAGTDSWYSLASVDIDTQKKLTRLERIAVRTADYINLGSRSVWYNGKGFIAKGSSDIVLDGKKHRMDITCDANSYIQRQIWAIFALALLLSGMVVVLALQYRVLNLRLIKPLDNLIQGMKAISQGNLDFRVQVLRSDEVGRFTESFNDMVSQLKESRENLKAELAVTKHQHQKMFAVYRDVIYAVTQGKLSLVGREEAPQFMDKGELISEIQIGRVKDVTSLRKEVKRIISGLFSEYQDSIKVLLCISEAAANIIKHAGTGICVIRKLNDDTIRFIFEDQGPGMDFDRLPSMIFYKGFSTKISAGCGFSLIYGFADEIVLSTSKYGTTLIFDVVFANRQRKCRQGANMTVPS